MKHSAALGNRLLTEHHDRVFKDHVWTYPAKTTNAAEFWRHTGVCPKCTRRSISAGRCIQCGHNPRLGVPFVEVVEEYERACDE